MMFRILLATLVLGLVAAEESECDKALVSGMTCNEQIYARDIHGRLIRDQGDNAIRAGECADYGAIGEACKCNAPFSGPACDLIKQAGGPSEVGSNIFVNSWQFLAKSCWGPEVSGTLKITLKWNRLECDENRCTAKNPETWDPDQTPRILFYGSHDESFENAVRESYRAQTLDAPYLTECAGDNALYSAPLVCTRPNLQEGDLDDGACHWSATFGVVNPEQQGMLIYVALAGCGLKGTVTWDVEVENNVAAFSGAYVCGAAGTFLEQRCFSEAGGTCHLQSFQAISTDYRVPYKISRATMAVVCLCVLGVVAIGLATLKCYQNRIKERRSKAIRNRIGLQKENGVSGNTEDEGEGGAAYAPQGNGLHAQQFIINGVAK